MTPIGPHGLKARFVSGALIAGMLATAVPQASRAAAVCAEKSGRIVRTEVDSRTYGAPTSMNIYLPPCYVSLRKALPAIYLLHGGGADEAQWPDLSVKEQADRLIVEGAEPFVVIMPGGDYSSGANYEAFVMRDLMPAVEGRYCVQASVDGRAIGGLSLGGYWALRLAFHHPDQFVAVGANSPVVGQGRPDDPIRLASTAGGLDRIRIRLDVGAADALRTGTARLAKALQARGLMVAIQISPGGHDRNYWRSHTAEYLRFYLNAFADYGHGMADRHRWPICRRIAPD